MLGAVEHVQVQVGRRARDPSVPENGSSHCRTKRTPQPGGRLTAAKAVPAPKSCRSLPLGASAMSSSVGHGVAIQVWSTPEVPWLPAALKNVAPAVDRRLRRLRDDAVLEHRLGEEEDVVDHQVGAARDEAVDVLGERRLARIRGSEQQVGAGCDVVDDLAERRALILRARAARRRARRRFRAGRG